MRQHRFSVAVALVGIAAIVWAGNQLAQSPAVEGIVRDRTSTEDLTRVRVDFDFRVDGKRHTISSQTDSLGRFEIDPKGATEGIVIFSADGYAPLRRKWPSKKEPTLVAEMDRAVPMSGTVRGLETDTALDGTVTVVVARVGNPIMVTGPVRNGSFGFSDLPPGPASVWARAKDMAPALMRVTLTSGEPLEHVDFHLQPAASIVGRVVDVNGLPLKGIAIRLGYENKALQTLEGFLGGSALTNENGEFRVKGIVPDEALLIQAAADQRSSQRLRILLAAGQETAATLQIK
jgi:hypothetical protein